jgi:hypothetical protein
MIGTSVPYMRSCRTFSETLLGLRLDPVGDPAQRVLVRRLRRAVDRHRGRRGVRDATGGADRSNVTWLGIAAGAAGAAGGEERRADDWQALVQSGLHIRLDTVEGTKVAATLLDKDLR